MPHKKPEDEGGLYGPGGMDDPLQMLSGPAQKVPLGREVENPVSILSNVGGGDGDAPDVLDPEAHAPEVNEDGPLGLPVVGPRWLVEDM